MSNSPARNFRSAQSIEQYVTHVFEFSRAPETPSFWNQSGLRPHKSMNLAAFADNITSKGTDDRNDPRRTSGVVSKNVT